MHYLRYRKYTQSKNRFAQNKLLERSVQQKVYNPFEHISTYACYVHKLRSI